MECKCGAWAKRSFEKFTSKQTAESTSGKEITALPCIVVKDHCPSCKLDAVTIWYPLDSKPINKSRSLMDAFNIQQ